MCPQALAFCSPFQSLLRCQNPLSGDCYCFFFCLNRRHTGRGFRKQKHHNHGQKGNKKSVCPDFHLLSLLSPRRAELERIGTAVIEICRINQYLFSCHLSLVNLLYHSIHVTAEDTNRSGYNHNFVYTAWQNIELVTEHDAVNFTKIRK